MTRKPSDPRFAGDTETRKRWREVQFLINIVEPDPEYQPEFVSDEASLLDCLGTDEREIVQKLAVHFGGDFKLDVSQPIWKLVDRLKALYVTWPDQ